MTPPGHHVRTLVTLVLIATPLAALQSTPRPLKQTEVVAPGPSEERVREIVRAFERLRSQNGLSGIVLADLKRLVGLDHPRIVSLALRVFERRDIPLYRTARQILASVRSPAALQSLLSDGVEHRDPEVRANAIEALADARPVTVDWRAPLRAGLADRDPRVRAAALLAVGRTRDDVPLERILQLTADPAQTVRQAVAPTLVRLVGARSLGVLDQLVRDPAWRVRLAAIRALADLKSRAGVTRLIEALGREDGRLREDIVPLLQRLTSQSFGADSAAWLRWLERAPESFLQLADDAVLYPTGGRYAADPSFRNYYDVSTASHRFVLVTDRSGSMGTRAPGEPTTNMGLAIEELVRLLGSLDETFAVNLIAFSGKVDAWRKQLVVADTRGRQGAIKEARSYKPDGNTNVFGSIELVMDMAEEAMQSREDGRYGDHLHELDTVFLLSDGMPTAGDVTHTDVILEYVAERNRRLQLRFHCISYFGRLPGGNWLRELALSTGGAYVHKSW